MLTRKEWLREHEESYVPGEYNEITPVSARRFINLISDPNCVFVLETYPYPNRYIRYKNETSAMRGSARTHNIDVDYENRLITYEGSTSIWHDVVGEDADFDKIIKILKSKEVNI